jgi:hypothetical protein
MSGDSSRPFGDSLAVVTGQDGRHTTHRDCFADEVIIDFPSVAPAIERIRSAFLEDECDEILRAQICLTPLEASEGKTVHLDVPVRTMCRECGGRGERWTEPCPRCASSGMEMVRHHVQVSVPARVNEGAKFRFRVATRHDPPTRVEIHVVIR